MGEPRRMPLYKNPSADQLDKMIRVTTVFSWLVLLGAFIITGSAVLWAATGVLYQDISARGVLMYDSGIVKVYADRGGIADDILVREGLWVDAGDPLLVISGRTVYSGYTGVIGRVFVHAGQRVPERSELMEIREIYPEQELIAVCYLPLAEGNVLSIGMEAVLIPALAGSGGYGRVTGYVKEVGAFGISEAAMYSRLGDFALVSSLKGGVPMAEIIIGVSTGTENEPDGEFFAFPAMTDVVIRIIVDEKTPLQYLLGS